MKVVSLKITHTSENFMLQYMCYAIRGGVSVLIEMKYDGSTRGSTSLIL